jgi:hypothetical protein
VVEWLTLLLRIREVQGSNFVRRPAIEVFRGSPQSLQANTEIGP